MIALPELHSLIKSLNKPEKRFFKLLSATENLQVEKAISLFDFLEKTTEHDDIYSKTEGERRVDTTAGNLSLLYKLILKSQRNFYSETIPGFRFNDELSALKILFEKAQNKQCRKMIRTIKERAITYERFNYLLEIIELEKDLLKVHSHNSNYSEEYESLLVQQNKAIEQEQNVADYYRLYSLLKYQIKSNNLNGKQTPMSFYEKFLASPEISDPKKARSKKAALLQLKCRALCYTVLKQQQLRRQHLQQLKKLVNENGFLFAEMPRQYLDILYNLANCFIETNETEKVKTILEEMLGIVNSKKIHGIDLIIKMKAYAFNTELLMLMYTAKFKEATALSLNIQKFISENEKIFNKEDKLILLFNLTNFFIYSCNFVQAEKMLQKQLMESDKKGRWDLKCYSRFQQMAVCIELKQYTRLPLIMDILRSHVKNNVFTTSTELRSIEFFEKLISKPAGNYSEKQFTAWHNALKSFNQNKKDRWINFFYFNLFAYSGYKAGAGEMKDIIYLNYAQNETV